MNQPFEFYNRRHKEIVRAPVGRLGANRLLTKGEAASWVTDALIDISGGCRRFVRNNVLKNLDQAIKRGDIRLVGGRIRFGELSNWVQETTSKPKLPWRVGFAGQPRTHQAIGEIPMSVAVEASAHLYYKERPIPSDYDELKVLYKAVIDELEQCQSLLGSE